MILTEKHAEEMVNSLNIPMVIEREAGGERGYDLFSRLLKDRIVILGTPINDAVSTIIVGQLLFLQVHLLQLEQVVQQIVQNAPLIHFSFFLIQSTFLPVNRQFHNVLSFHLEEERYKLNFQVLLELLFHYYLFLFATY